MSKKKKEENKEKICANCIHFKRNEDGTVYTRGAGNCECIPDKAAFDKDGKIVILKTQIFSHFHCSNNNFNKL